MTTVDIKHEIHKVIVKLNEKNPYYLVIGLLVLVLIVDYIFIMQFQLGALRALGPKLAEISDHFKEFETNRARVGKYEEDIKDLDQKLDNLEKRLRTTEEIPAVLEGISRIANRSKVFIDQIIPETDLGEPVFKNAQGKYYLLPVRVEAKASYHNFGRFLNELETQGSLMMIDDMMIETNLENPRQHLVKLSIQAVIFEPAGGSGE